MLSWNVFIISQHIFPYVQVPQLFTLHSHYNLNVAYIVYILPSYFFLAEIKLIRRSQESDISPVLLQVSICILNVNMNNEEQ